MKSRKTEIAINLAILAFWIIVSVALIIFACVKLNVSPVKACIFAFIGLILNYALAVAVHELGHVIFAKICKMKLLSVNFGLFSIEYGEKTKVRFFTYLQPEAGELSFVSTKRVTANSLKLVSFGGLLFSALYCAICLVCLASVFSAITFCLLAVGSCSAFYLLTVNALPLDKTSDGALLFSKSDYLDVLAQISNVDRAILQDKMPEEPPIFKTSKQPLAIYYHYLYLTLNDRREEAIALLETLQTDLENLTTAEYLLIFPELAYNAFERGIADTELKLRAEILFLQDDSHPAFLRSHAKFRSYCGDNDWAKILFGSYLKTLKNSPAFIKEFESKIGFEENFNVKP